MIQRLVWLLVLFPPFHLRLSAHSISSERKMATQNKNPPVTQKLGLGVALMRQPHYYKVQYDRSDRPYRYEGLEFNPSFYKSEPSIVRMKIQTVHCRDGQPNSPFTCSAGPRIPKIDHTNYSILVNLLFSLVLCVTVFCSFSSEFLLKLRDIFFC